MLEAAVPELLGPARDYTAASCAALSGSVIPPAAVHRDFVACNVVKTDVGFRIFDWSDVVGHPLFAGDRLLDRPRPAGSWGMETSAQGWRAHPGRCRQWGSPIETQSDRGRYQRFRIFLIRPGWSSARLARSASRA